MLDFLHKMTKKKIDFGKSFVNYIVEAINNNEKKTATQEQIHTYLMQNYDHSSKSSFISILKQKIKKTLRNSRIFTKCIKKDKAYMWKVVKTEPNEEPIYETPKHIGKFINLPLIKCKQTYENKTVIFNSLYHRIKNNKVERKRYNFKINDIYDYNRSIGDHLRMYFSVNETYRILKVKLTEGVDLQDKFFNLLEDLEINTGFVWKDVDYNYVNDIIGKYCREKSRLDEKNNQDAANNLDMSIFEKIDFFDSTVYNKSYED